MIVERVMTGILRRISAKYAAMQQLDHLADPSAGDPSQRLMLYLHVPFCVVLCPFCSFHRVEYREDKAERYFEALRKEIEIVHAAGYRFGEIYVGGGTPTVDPHQLAQTIELVRRLSPIRRVSIETNPDDLAPERLKVLRDAGVNRLSVGVQSLEDGLLAEMQRRDKYGGSEEIRDRLAAVQGMFDTLNVDLIFNLPHQTIESVRRDLDILTREIGVDQVSCYPLMGSNSTKVAMKKGMGRVTYDREKDYYFEILDRLPSAYTASSAWCFSRGDDMIDEYITERDDYVGLGSGAMSYLDGTLYAASFSINRYVRLVEAGHTGITRYTKFNEYDRMRYYFLMRFFGLKVNKAETEARWNGRFARRMWLDFAAFRSLGAIRDDGEHWYLTRRGMYYWVLMMREFFIAVSNFRDLMRLGIRSELGPEEKSRLVGAG